MEFTSFASKWHKLWSIRFLILAGCFAGLTQVYPTLPSDWVSTLPDWFKMALGYTGMFFGGLGGISVVIKQAKLDDPKS
jgi:hypothetical protein